MSTRQRVNIISLRFTLYIYTCKSAISGQDQNQTNKYVFQLRDGAGVYMSACAYSCFYVRVCVHVCMCVRACVRTCVHASVRVCARDTPLPLLDSGPFTCTFKILGDKITEGKMQAIPV